MVPLGVRDEPHMETVKLFCPKCQDVYVHPSHAAQSEFVVSDGVSYKGVPAPATELALLLD